MGEFIHKVGTLILLINVKTGNETIRELCVTFV